MTVALKNYPSVWCIGGIDSSGGAGVTRDVITLADLDVHGCIITTQLTAQSRDVMVSSEASRISTINAQWQVLTQEEKPKAIKLGAIANDEQALLICSRIRSLEKPRPFVVWDPVIHSSSGGRLSTLSEDVVTELLSVVDIVTPNAQELCLLTHRTSAALSLEDMILGAISLIERGTASVLVKGGHAAPQQNDLVCDIFITSDTVRIFAKRRSATGELRGTGCMLASALCAFVSHHYDIIDALVLAIAYVHQIRQKSTGAPKVKHLPQTSGFPLCPGVFPDVYYSSQAYWTRATVTGFAKLTECKLGIYPVVDSVEWIKRLLPTGVKILQLRLKEGSEQFKQTQIKQAIDITRHAKCQLFVNDHWEWAIALGAYGVHLGQEDLDTADLHAIQSAGLRLGVSTHGYAEIQRVKALRPSYIALGHIFPTKTKEMPSSPQGIARLASYVPLCEDIPTVAIGGISHARVNAVAQTKVNGIAVVTAITEAEDPLKAYHALVQEADCA